jgi:hypothetical protein
MATRVGTISTPSPSEDATTALATGAADCLSAARHLDKNHKPDQTGGYILVLATMVILPSCADAGVVVRTDHERGPAKT